MILVADIWILVLCSLQDHLLPEELLSEEWVMQQRNKNVTQEVERVAMEGKAGEVNEVYVKKIFAMYI